MSCSFRSRRCDESADLRAGVADYRDDDPYIYFHGVGEGYGYHGGQVPGLANRYEMGKSGRIEPIDAPIMANNLSPGMNGVFWGDRERH
jgi:hypothetical protein